MSEKLAKASSWLMDITGGNLFSGSSYSTEPKKMNVPEKWEDIVALIRYYYERDPLASTVINKFVDIGINDLMNVRGEVSEEIFETYESFKDDLLLFLRDMAREYQLSGLVIPVITWKNVETLSEEMPEGEIDFDLANPVLVLPESFWLRDPITISARKTPIENRVNYYVKITPEMYDFITNKGRYPDGTRDEETYQILVKQHPEFVRTVERGETELKLDPFIAIRRSPVTGKAYPTPYLMNVLESLSHKRNLRKMDYSIASRVISAIQVVRLGNDTFPLTEADEDQFVELKAQMRHGRGADIERVFQLFGNHTLQIEWVFPDTKAMLDSNKYKAVDQDIMFGMGFPRILISGETEKSATSSPEFAMFSPSESIKAMRNDLMQFINKFYKKVAELNGFKEYPRPEFAELKLYDVEKMTNAVRDMYEKGVLSRTSYLGISGHDFDDEIANIVRERGIMKEEDIPEFAPMAFSPQPGVPGSSPQQDKPKTDEDADA